MRWADGKVTRWAIGCGGGWASAKTSRCVKGWNKCVSEFGRYLLASKSRGWASQYVAGKVGSKANACLLEREVSMQAGQARHVDEHVDAYTSHGVHRCA